MYKMVTLAFHFEAVEIETFTMEQKFEFLFN